VEVYSGDHDFSAFCTFGLQNDTECHGGHSLRKRKRPAEFIKIDNVISQRVQSNRFRCLNRLEAHGGQSATGVN